MKKFISSVSIAVLIMLMIVSTVGAANKPDKNKKAVKNVLVGKTYKGYGNYNSRLNVLTHGHHIMKTETKSLLKKVNL